MSEHQITVLLPEGLKELLPNPSGSISQEVIRLVVLELFNEGEISSGKAAELLGMSGESFRELLYQRNIPYFDYTKNEMQEEFTVIRELQEEYD